MDIELIANSFKSCAINSVPVDYMIDFMESHMRMFGSLEEIEEYAAHMNAGDALEKVVHVRFSNGFFVGWLRSGPYTQEDFPFLEFIAEWDEMFDTENKSTIQFQASDLDGLL